MSGVSSKIDQNLKSRSESIHTQLSNRLIRPEIWICKKKRKAPFDSAPPKTPKSEVWSKIDKDSKSRPEPITSTQLNRSIRPEISIFKKKEYQHSIQRARKPPYARFGQKSTKMRKVDQKRSVRGCRIDRFDLKYRFSRKTNSAIRFSAPENPHIRGLVKNRQRFEKSTRSDQFGTVESIDSTTNIDFSEKPIPPFDSAPSKTPISEISSKIDKDSKSRPKAIKKSINRSVATDQGEKTQNKHQQ